MQLRVDDNGNTRTRSRGSVKPNVTDTVLHDFAETLEGFTQESVERKQGDGSFASHHPI